MSLPISSQSQVKRWRMIVFDIVAVLLILFFAGFFSGVLSLLPPWVVLEAASPTYHPDIHRWHSAIWGVWTAILLSGSLIALLWQPQRKPLLAHFFLIGTLFISLIALVFRSPNPLNFIAPLFIALLFLLVYPAPSSLFHFSQEGGWSMPLLIGSALATLLIAPDIWRTITLQINDKTAGRLHLIAQGCSNTEIATHLVLSIKTMRNHISNILSKLQVADRAQAIIRAREAGLG